MLRLLLLSLGLLAAAIPATAQPPASGQPIATPPGTPGSPAGGFQKGERKPDPLEAGSTELFSYRPAPGEPGVFLVDMSDGRTIPVSEGYLASIVRSRQPLELKAQAIQSYPSISNQMIDQLMGMHYPDPNSAPTAPMGERTLQGENGESYILTDDPVAKGYVRVSRVGADGQILEEFTVSRPFVDQIFSKPYTTDLLKIQELTKFPFRLPDDLRTRVNDMTTTDLRKEMQQRPPIKDQQIFKAARVIDRMLGEDGNDLETTESRETALQPNVPVADEARQPGQDDPARTAKPTPQHRTEKDSPESLDRKQPESGDKTGTRVAVGAILVLGLGAAAWLLARRR